MFKRIKEWFTNQKRKDIDYIQKTIESLHKSWSEEINKVREDLISHAKLVGAPRTKIIHGSAWYVGSDPVAREHHMQEYRDEYTKEGYKFNHSKSNGDEVWSKIESQ